MSPTPASHCLSQPISPSLLLFFPQTSLVLVSGLDCSPSHPSLPRTTPISLDAALPSPSLPSPSLPLSVPSSPLTALPSPTSSSDAVLPPTIAGLVPGGQVGRSDPLPQSLPPQSLLSSLQPPSLSPSPLSSVPLLPPAIPLPVATCRPVVCRRHMIRCRPVVCRRRARPWWPGHPFRPPAAVSAAPVPAFAASVAVSVAASAVVRSATAARNPVAVRRTTWCRPAVYRRRARSWWPG